MCNCGGFYNGFNGRVKPRPLSEQEIAFLKSQVEKYEIKDGYFVWKDCLDEEIYGYPAPVGGMICLECGSQFGDLLGGAGTANSI